MSKLSKSLSVSGIRKVRCFIPFHLSPHPNLNPTALRQVLKQHLVTPNLPVTDESLQRKIKNTCLLNVLKLHKDREMKVNLTVKNILIHISY